jgi:hypothetical protein
MHARIAAAVMTLAICGHPAQTSAQEFCVTCTGPDAKYRCAIGGDPPPSARSSRGQLLCISELAQSGPHASCSVGRTTAEPCEGELRIVMFPAGADIAPPFLAAPQAAPSPDAPAPGPAVGEGPYPDAPAEAPPQPSQPPKTVEELAKQTVEASGKGLKQAGEAVGETAKSTGEAVGNALSNTWKCMSSLFSDC